MVFKKKKPEFTREELEGMLKKQEAKEKEDHVQYEEPEEMDIEEIELDDDMIPKPKKVKPKVVASPTKEVPPEAKVITQQEANEIIDEEAKEEKKTEPVAKEFGPYNQFREIFKQYVLEDKETIISDLTSLIDAHRLFLLTQKAQEEYGNIQK